MIVPFFASWIQIIIFIEFYEFLMNQIGHTKLQILLNSFVLNSITFGLALFNIVHFNYILAILYLFLHTNTLNKSGNIRIRKKLYLALTALIVPSLLGYSINYLLSYLTYLFFNPSTSLYNISYIITEIILFIAVLYLKQTDFKVTFSFSSVPVFISLLIAFLSFVILAHFFANTSSKLQMESFQKSPHTQFLILFLLFLSFVILLISARLDKKRFEKLRKELLYEDLWVYTKHLEILHDELSTFRHDYVNILLSLSESIRERNMDSVEKIFNNTLIQTTDIVEQKKLSITKLNRIKSMELKSVLAVKIVAAQQQNIAVTIDIPFDIYNFSDFIDLLDLIRICTILLDNAIEEATNSLEKEILIAMYQYKNQMNLSVKNSCTSNKIDINKIFEKDYSSKETINYRGLGLFSLQQILKSNTQCSIQTDVEGRYFEQLIFMKKRQ